LIKEGYLSCIKVLNNGVSVDLEGVKIKGKEYDQNACGVKFNAIAEDAVKDFKKLFVDNNISTALIFASTIENGNKIVDEYGNHEECKLAHGDMPTHERNEIITWLKEGTGKRYLVNVGLYTRGFDFPELEALVLFRATTSLRLYVQILGRLIRSHESKEFGFLADYGTNVERFGPIDNLTPPKPPRSGEAPRKLCLIPECGEANLLSAKACKACGALFISENEEGLYSMQTKAQALALKHTHRHEITSVLWESAFSRKSSLPMIKGLFYEDNELVYTHYLCLEHTGFAAENSKRFLMSMFKDKKDYFLLGKTHINCKSILTLLNEAPKFFKTIKAIELHDQEESRFKKLEKVIYE
jgi:DNA repair protein RadD